MMGPIVADSIEFFNHSQAACDHHPVYTVLTFTDLVVEREVRANQVTVTADFGKSMLLDLQEQVSLEQNLHRDDLNSDGGKTDTPSYDTNI